MDNNVNVLDEINKGATMGMDAIKFVYDKVGDQTFKKVLDGEYRKYQDISNRISVEYDGKDFNGWQKQPNKLNIQGEIERAISEITKETNIDLTASGRTDAGVHAIGQVANFK